MTKFNEIKDDREYQSKSNYISSCWNGWEKIWKTALNRITNYLFALNTGALLVSMTYIATKSSNANIQISIWLFAFGILCSLLHAGIDYYLVEISYSRYKKSVKRFWDNEIDWNDLVEDNGKPSKTFDWFLHLLGWVGAASFLIGLVNGILQLNPHEPKILTSIFPGICIL